MDARTHGRTDGTHGTHGTHGTDGDHERVLQGCHHGQGEPVELKTERDVIRMAPLAYTLRGSGRHGTIPARAMSVQADVVSA